MKNFLYYMLLVVPLFHILQADEKSNKNLLDASKNGKSDIIFNLIKRDGADINTTDEQGRTPLMFAAENHQPTTIERLLEHKPNLNALDHKGNTALIHTFIPGKRITDQQRHIAEILLEHGANPSIKNKQRQSALDLVNTKQNDELAQQTKKIIKRYINQR